MDFKQELQIRIDKLKIKINKKSNTPLQVLQIQCKIATLEWILQDEN